MTWPEVRKQFPNKWLLVEATQAATKVGKRIVEQVAVVNMYPSGAEAWKDYKNYRRATPGREYIVLHTDVQRLEFEELPWAGVRPSL